MLKWLKDALVQQLVREIRINAERYEIIINLLRDQNRAITNLNRKVNEQMSELADAVQSIKDDVVRIGDGVKSVLALLTQPNPDVTSAIAALKEADAGLDAAADSMDAVLNPTPTEPPV